MSSRSGHRRSQTEDVVVPLSERRTSTLSTASGQSASGKSALDEAIEDGSINHSVDEEVAKDQQRGVSRIEALYRVFGENRSAVWTLYAAIAGVVCAFSLDSNTTSLYLQFATSDYHNLGLLGSISTAESLMTAMCKPFIAKICDITSRQHAYILVVAAYTIGYIVIASSTNVAALCIGRVIATVGEAGLDLVTDIIVADLSPLQWRGFVQALTSAPNIPLAFLGAKLAARFISADEWRWGYGMFCVLIPVMVTPAILVLFLADRKATKKGDLSFAASPYERRVMERYGNTLQKPTWWQLCKLFYVEIDGNGLILLAAGLSLLLLPLTLAPKADGQWSNPSMIAMFVLGGVFMIGFAVWEYFFATIPLMPKRLIYNRTFQLAVAIDFLYFFSGLLRSVYYNTYVYVITDWTTEQWGYFSNASTVALSVFGLLAGLWLRYTHRYKYLQVSGLVIRTVGMGLTLYARGSNATDAALAWVLILIYMGGSFSVVGSRVASQASVPHQDLATTVAFLSLWTKIGGALGAAVAAVVWQSNMPSNMRKFLGPDVPQETVNALFSSVKKVRLPEYAQYRPAVIQAYDATVYPLFLSALVTCSLAIIAGVLMPNYYLGKTQNAVDGTDAAGRKTAASRPDYDNTRSPDEQAREAASGQIPVSTVPSHYPPVTENPATANDTAAENGTAQEPRRDQPPVVTTA